MKPNILRTIPSELVELVNSGQAQIYGGIIKDNISGKIIGHLEQIGEIGVTNLLDPNLVGSTSKVISLAQNQKIINQISSLTNMMNTVHALSWVNLAFAGVNLGVSMVGFTVMNNKLNDIGRQLININQKLNVIADKVESQVINENRKLIESAMRYIDKVKLDVVELDSKGMSEMLSHNIGHDLIEIKSFLLRNIDQYSDQQLISLELEIIIAVYLVYMNLSKAYIRSKAFNKEDIALLNETFEIREIKDKMISGVMLDNLHHKYIFDRSRLYSEKEIDCISEIYKYTCEENYKGYDSQYQLLNSIPIIDLIEIDSRLRKIEMLEEEKYILVTY